MRVLGMCFVLLERRILDGKPGVQGEASSPLSVFHRAKGINTSKDDIFYIYATDTSEEQPELAQ